MMAAYLSVFQKCACEKNDEVSYICLMRFAVACICTFQVFFFNFFLLVSGLCLMNDLLSCVRHIAHEKQQSPANRHAIEHTPFWVCTKTDFQFYVINLRNCNSNTQLAPSLWIENERAIRA